MDEEERKTTQDRVLEAALAHVAFDGWTETTLRAAIAESGAEPALARALFPRGAVDLALYWHERGDRTMLDRLAATDLADMRFRDRVQTALRLRIEAIGDKEALRRSMAFIVCAAAPCPGRHAGALAHLRSRLGRPWRYVRRCELVYQAHEPFGRLFRHAALLAGGQQQQ